MNWERKAGLVEVEDDVDGEEDVDEEVEGRHGQLPHRETLASKQAPQRAGFAATARGVGGLGICKSVEAGMERVWGMPADGVQYAEFERYGTSDVEAAEEDEAVPNDQEGLSAAVTMLPAGRGTPWKFRVGNCSSPTTALLALNPSL